MNRYRHVCIDCGEPFEGHKLKMRCPDCERKHHAMQARACYAAKKARGQVSPPKHVHFLDLPCPWTDGRLPDSVTRNALWA